ncbi:MAG: hypothetical protein LLF89_02675 [Spirochaetaceae bacterium]|nr:hypothetical protein [Spirochaetaceae bacterium]
MAFAMVIFAGTAGFLLLFAADFLDVGKSTARKAHRAASALRWIGYGMIALVLACIAFSPGPWWPFRLSGKAETTRLIQPGAVEGPFGVILPALLWIAACVSLGMLAWTVFIEIGLIRKKRGLAPNQLVSEGSYGRCRHPGFWWFVSLALALGLLRSFASYLITIFVMIMLDLSLIYVQDNFVFPKLFAGYDEYRRQVPFLIPHRGGKRQPADDRQGGNRDHD